MEKMDKIKIHSKSENSNSEEQLEKSSDLESKKQNVESTESEKQNVGSTESEKQNVESTESEEEDQPSPQEEYDKLKDRLMRSMADFENFRRRAQKEKLDAINYGTEKLLKDLIPIIDNMERAIEHGKNTVNNKTGDLQVILQGVRMVYEQFQSLLDNYDIKPFYALGENFNPEKHEAIQQIEDNSVEPGTVIVEIQKGYYLKDRLIRPALVSIAKEPEGNINEETENTEQDKD